MNDITGRRGSTAKTTHWIIHLSSLLQFGLQTLASMKLLMFITEKVAFKFSAYIFDYQPKQKVKTGEAQEQG